jgi:hypothetical protein
MDLEVPVEDRHMPACYVRRMLGACCPPFDGVGEDAGYVQEAFQCLR